MGNQLTSELIAAAEEGNKERCQQLLSQGADANGTSGVSSEGVDMSHSFSLSLYL